ncbi:MAG: PD40 domain-containing protein, partial [Leptospiraceae bacterium]|nr:PD40 domain-containing protein [Leptospiraceae bacterium]
MSTVIAKKIFLAILLLFLIHTGNCRFLQKREKTLPLTFDYAKISTNYFSPANEDPYPLTIQRGDNLYNSTTSDGKTLFYTTNNRGNYDIWFRDLKSSIIVPVTSHPAPEYKPAISPDGTKLAFVSEQYDSEGDIFFLEMNPKKWKEAYLKGERFINTDFKNISNPNYSDPKNARRYIDTDPCWSPDGKFLAYSTESLSPGLQNIVIYELKTKKIIKQITSEGGTSPYWALDGRYISYISYKNHSNGEIYRYDLQTNTHERLTHNEYIEYSPSLSPNGNILFYTSVRNPQKKEKGKEITDNGMIIRYNVSQKKEQHLSSETFPVFDTRYSRFGCADELEQFMNPVQKQKYREECGSILFSASLYNTINVYFIPAEGSIPKQATIEEQFNFALRYQKYQSYEGVVLALDSIKLFFEEDPLYPIFKAKAEMFKAQLNENSGRHDKAKQIIEEQLKQKNQKDGFYPYALASIFHKEGKRGTLETLEQYYDSVKAEKLIPLQQKYAILELIGEEREAINKRALSIEAYARILNEFPEYYNTNTIKQKISRLKFYSEQEIIPAYYLELINNPAIKRSRLNTIQNDIEKNIWKNRNYVEVNQLIDKLNQKEELQKQCAGLHRLLIYIKAKALYEGKDFQNSLGLINSYIGVYEAKPIIDPANKASVFDRKFDFDDPLYLKSLWLRAKNYEGLGTLQGDNGEGFFNQMKFFLVNYDDTFGVEIAEEEIEKSFRYYENQARKYTNQYFETKRKLASAKNIPDKEKKIQDNLKILRSAAIHYFYNTENMFLLKSKNLYLNTLYSQYAIYYYKKMIDSAFIYGKEIREHNSKAVLDFLNTNIVGTSTNFLSKVATNTYTSKVTDKLKVLGDFRDLKIEEVLGEDALFIINQHFKEGIPRARNYLYLAAIYGYAYYLIGKAIIYEDFYNQTGMMTPNRKEKILNDLKKAELELKWAIFANPQFADAYQLLGWLYQYVDVSKTQKLYSDSVSVGEEYESEYNIHFPGRHLEENVELYRQILDFLGEAPDKKLLSDLNLNLANNYLLLNSYPKAKEHYAKVEEYGKSIIDTSRFENYRQKALFHYNYARTLLYLGNYEQSSEEFGKVADIYLNNEFYKAYALGEANPGTQSESIHYVAKKLVLINALGGLAEMEGGNFRQAIRSLRRAVSYNAEVHLIPDYSLYNFLAICYQQVEDYSTANYFVKLAIEKNTDKNEKEKTESYFWELILPRKNRVHGDSRFPGGFPPIYQYLLSKGIEIKNFEEQREYSETLKLLNEREAFIKKNELDSMPSGQSILSNTISRKAYNEYKQGEFINSAKTYKES